MKRYLVAIIVVLMSIQIITAQEEATEEPESPTPDTEITPEALPEIDPLAGGAPAPPMDITLPDEWVSYYDGFVFNDLGELRVVPFAVYSGPITNGQGFIVVLWGFTNVATGNPILGNVKVDLYIDGLRLLRLVILESDCLVGTELQQTYTVGGIESAGTQFSAVNCPNTADTAGWFAALNAEGMNYAFYMFSEPIDAMLSLGRADLENILNTVVFYPADILAPEATPEVTAEPESQGE